MTIPEQKARARKAAKKIRAAIDVEGVGKSLIKNFPFEDFPAQNGLGSVVAGFWPLAGEVDVIPLLGAFQNKRHKLALPCTPPAGQPLIFRHWMTDEALKHGPYDTREPHGHVPEITPTLVLLPLLAFSEDGKRLGYGGGFYDRTISGLREVGEVFACGVAYAGQEASEIPTDEYDQKLDGILTEQYFRKFT